VPIYGYRCQACEQEFEVTQRMSDPAVAACPACSAAGTRLFFPAGIVFKGSGFYKTDSRSASVAASPASGDTGKTSETASDGAAAKPGKESTGKPGKESTSTPAPAPASSTTPAKSPSSSSTSATSP
jgi:putative FmdB family regulatory protein